MEFCNGLCDECAATITNFDNFVQKVKEVQIVLSVCERKKVFFFS